MSVDAWIFGGIAALTAIAGVGLVVVLSRSGNQLLETWARQNGFRLVSRDYRIIDTGPFYSTSGRRVYRVTVEDRDGKRRSAFVRCGGWFWGVLTEGVEVRWDD